MLRSKSSLRPVAQSVQLLPSAQRRKIKMALCSMGNSNASQFSSFIGDRMFLPQLYVRRAVSFVVSFIRKPPQMSFLGVGAPEALLVGVVALIVFGPKGLAEAAKSVGQALRSFQPTIKEVMSVSQELKGTLEKELGLDELRDAARSSPAPYRPPLLSTESPAMEDPDIEAKRAEAAKMAWGGSGSDGGASSTPTLPSADTLKDSKASSLSMEELEAELERRKKAAK